MADEKESSGKGRREPTSELSLSELQAFEPVTDEIAMNELEEVDDVEEVSELEEVDVEALPATPGLGKPRRPQRGKRPDSTLIGVAAPVIAVGGSSPPPPPSAARVPSVPPPAPRKAKTPTKKPPKPKTPTKKPPKPKKPAKRTTKPRAAVKKSEATPPPSDEAAATVETPARPPRDEAVEATEALRDLCLEQLRNETNPDRKAQLHYELGRLFEVTFDEPAKAAEHYQGALRTRGDHAAALRGARRMLAKLDRSAALPALYDAEIAITREPKDRAHLLYVKARLMEEQLRQAGPALAVYKEALGLDPGNLVALKAIERSLRRDKNWVELEKIYEQLANAVEDVALRAAWTGVRARLTETHLGDPVQAAALYEAALDADPHATAALANVKRLGAEQKRWPQLVRALLAEHDLCGDEDTRAAILTTVAGIEERRLGDAEAAVATLTRALTARPKDAAILREVARLHRSSGRHAQEIEALDVLVARTEDKDERARLAFRIGHLYEQMLGDGDRARAWYEETLSTDPRHRAASLALSRLHELHARWNDLVAVLSARAKDGVSSLKERADIHHRVGLIVERELGDEEGAIAHHSEALAIEPDHHDAFAAIARLWAKAARWRELAELYERAIDSAKHDGEVVMWLFRVGAIREDRLDDPRSALAAYARVLEKDPEHLGALHAIERAGTRAGEHVAVVDAIRKQAALTEDPARSAALLHRAADVTANAIGDPPGAMRALEEILRRQPKHRASLETLASLLFDAGKWKELIGVYKRLLPLTSTADEKVYLHYRMGEIQETQIGALPAAIQCYRATLQLEPEYAPAREALLGALWRSESWPELVKALEERLPRLPTPLARARAATELGVLYEERLQKRDRALSMYEKAIEEVPLHRPALDARERLFTEASDWHHLSEALEAEAKELTDPFLKTQTALRAALIRADEQGATAPALDAFRPVFAQRPDHIGALLAVEEIYARTRDDSGLAVTYEKMVDVVNDPRAKLAALHELARARAASDGDTCAVQRRILQHAPNDAAAMEALAEEAQRNQDGNTELAMHARLASTARDPRVGAYYQTRVGELLLAEKDATGALAAFRAALNLDPTSLGATRGLSRAALRADDADALRSAAHQEKEVTRDRRAAVSLFLEAAFGHMVGEEIDEATVDYEEALALDPENLRAAAGLRATLCRPDQAPKLIDLLGRAAAASEDVERSASLHLAIAELQAEVREDLAAAIAAVRRALEVRASDPEALSHLADYLERNSNWGDAVATLEELLPKVRDDKLVDAHLRLAKIADERLDDPERAIRSLRAVLQREEDNEVALTALIRLERIRGRTEEALRIAKKLIQVVSSESRRAAVLTELAELERGRGEPGAAATHAFSAIGIQGPGGPAAELYKELIANSPEHATWDNYSTGLMTFLEKTRAQGGASATYRELARVFSDAHNRPDRAIATLREGVEACPDDAGISLALVKALRGLKADDKALVEVRRFLKVDAWQPQGWRMLAELLRSAGEPDGAATALAPLVAMKQATDEEEQLVRARTPRVATAPGGILGRQGLEQIIDRGGLDESAALLVHALSDVFGKIEAFDHERFGVNKRDRLKKGDPHPVRAFADRIGTTFGVPEFEVFIVDTPDIEWACVYAGSPPVLVVPRRLERARDAILAFQLARPLAILSRLLHPVDRIDPMTLERLLVAAARQFEPDFTLRPSDADLESETRRVAKGIGFFSRGRIQDAATTFAATPTQDIGQWVRDVRLMGARAALLVCDDLLSAFEALGAEKGADDLMADLARFWVSDPAMRFRRRVAQQL